MKKQNKKPSILCLHWLLVSFGTKRIETSIQQLFDVNYVNKNFIIFTARNPTNLGLYINNFYVEKMVIRKGEIASVKAFHLTNGQVYKISKVSRFILNKNYATVLLNNLGYKIDAKDMNKEVGYYV